MTHLFNLTAFQYLYFDFGFSADDIQDKEKEFINRMLTYNIPCCIRPVDPETYYRKKPGEPKRLLWMKANGTVGR